MKLVYTSDSDIDVGIVKSLLESEDIGCFIKNQGLSGALGMLPANEIWPQLWVRHDQDETESLDIINAFLSETQTVSNWICACGEMIEGQFTECWNCGHANQL